MSGGGCAPLPRCPAGGRCPAGAAAPLRRRAALPPRCRLLALGRLARMQAGREASGAVVVRHGGWAGGSQPPQAPATRPPARPPLTRVCGAAAASRQHKWTALHEAAHKSHAPCVESLLKAGADASLEDEVSDGAEGQGGRRGGVGARGWGWGGGGALRRRRAASPRRPQPPPSAPGAGASTSAPPPRRSEAARRRTAPWRRGTRRSSSSWRTTKWHRHRRAAPEWLARGCAARAALSPRVLD